MGVKIRPAQLKRRSTAVELGRKVYVSIKIFLIWGYFSSVSKPARPSLRYCRTTPFSGRREEKRRERKRERERERGERGALDSRIKMNISFPGAMNRDIVQNGERGK